MSGKFTPVAIKSIHKTTKDAVSITFQLTEEQKLHFNNYEHGQYITVQLHLNDEEIRRSYSISSSYHLNEPLTIAVKCVEGGKASNYINEQLKPGDKLELLPPEGKFTLKNASETQNYVFFAGGSGITPIMALIKEIVTTKPSASIQLFYGNRDDESIIYKNELSALSEKYSQINITHILEKKSDWTDYVGLLTSKTCRRLIKKNKIDVLNSVFFICGPGAMMEEVVSALNKKKTPASHIILEYFSAPDTSEQEVAEEKNEFKGTAHVHISLDGMEYDLKIPHNQSILSVMLANGIDAPYSCQGGVCSTCRAKIISGDVMLKQNFGITDKEVAEGYTLTCNSFPRSKEITIDFED